MNRSISYPIVYLIQIMGIIGVIVDISVSIFIFSISKFSFNIIIIVLILNGITFVGIYPVLRLYQVRLTNDVINLTNLFRNYEIKKSDVIGLNDSIFPFFKYLTTKSGGILYFIGDVDTNFGLNELE